MPARFLRAFRRLYAVAIVIGLCAPWQMANAKPADMVVRDRFSDEIGGNGPDLIFIPGLASSRDTWRAQASRLEAHYRVHLIQVAGFAGEPARANASGDVVTSTAEAIDAYLVENHLLPAVVIGHSLGGTMTLYLAEHHAEHLKKALIVDALPFFATVGGNSNATVASMAPIAAGIRANAAPDTPQQLAKRMASMATEQSNKDLIAGWSQTSDATVLRNALADDLILDLRPRLSTITTPLTLIYPDYAPLGVPKGATDAQYSGAYAAVLKMKFVLVTNSLHFIMLDQPKQFDAALDSFLAN